MKKKKRSLASIYARRITEGRRPDDEEKELDDDPRKRRNVSRMVYQTGRLPILILYSNTHSINIQLHQVRVALSILTSLFAFPLPQIRDQACRRQDTFVCVRKIGKRQKQREMQLVYNKSSIRDFKS